MPHQEQQLLRILRFLLRLHYEDASGPVGIYYTYTSNSIRPSPPITFSSSTTPPSSLLAQSLALGTNRASPVIRLCNHTILDVSRQKESCPAPHSTPRVMTASSFSSPHIQTFQKFFRKCLQTRSPVDRVRIPPLSSVLLVHELTLCALASSRNTPRSSSSRHRYSRP